MKKSIIKIFSVLLIAILCVAILSSTIMATTLEDAQDVKKFRDSAKDTTNTASFVSEWLGAALVVVQVVGVGVAVIMLVVLAIKYISAAPSDKAEIKKHAVVYVVGAIVLFAASGILGLIRRFAEGANSALE